jgi:hypothetical protein
MAFSGMFMGHERLTLAAALWPFWRIKRVSAHILSFAFVRLDAIPNPLRHCNAAPVSARQGRHRFIYYPMYSVCREGKTCA